MPPKKNRSNFRSLTRPVIFAHRGSSAHAPENTLAAFRLAVQQHAGAIELDAKLSADGEVVVMHDDTVDRTTTGNGAVNSLTLDELRKLDAGSKFNRTYQSERIPTLAEVFEAVGNHIFINVELTNYASPGDKLPEKVVELVKNYGLEGTTLLSSFDLMNLIRARFLHSRIQLGLLTHQGYAHQVMQTGLVRFGPRLALHPNAYDITPELIQAAHRMDCQVFAYTVNRASDIQQLFAIGVDGIFTDDPLVAQKVLLTGN